MQKIRRVSIKNFRSIIQASLVLDEDLTVLIGENSAGKTAVLEGLAAALTPAVDEFSRRRRPGSRIRGIQIEDFHRTTNIHARHYEVQAGHSAITVEMTDGLVWNCDYFIDIQNESPQVKGVLEVNGPNSFAQTLQTDGRTAPVIAYYGIDRNTQTSKRRPQLVENSMLTLHPRLDRRGGYSQSLESKAVFIDAVDWFAAYEGLELRQQREFGSEYKDVRLEAVRKAVTSILPNVKNLRMLGLPPKLTADMTMPDGTVKALAFEQLSGGYRSFAAMIIDISRRMVDINPHLTEPLAANGIVMIDEIDLHLHPSWQQKVVSQLRSNFPNIQFILTTHSPQVITTLSEENVRVLRWGQDELLFDPVPSINGAKSGRALEEVMGVGERPPAEISEFVEKLQEYRSMVRSGEWDTVRAEDVLIKLRSISPDDPELHALSLERRRLKVLHERSR